MSVAALVALLRRRYAPDAPDADLLRAYAESRDETAFRRLVARHGPPALRLCQRLLGDEPDAEDAFQAVFLTLARRAGSVRRPEALAAWLYGVARRVCGNARTARARRRAAEASAPLRMVASPAEELSARELLDVLDDELHRLPGRYRLPVLLVYWQGLTQADAARRLGLTFGALHGRLERGRAKLAARLARRGFAPGDLRPLLMAPLGTTAVPSHLLTATVALAGDPWSKTLPAAVLALAAAGTSVKLVSGAAIGVLLAGVGLAALAGRRAGDFNDRSETRASVAYALPSPADEQPDAPRLDRFGDPLPPGAVMRLGTLRHRTSLPAQRQQSIYLPGGNTLLTYVVSRVQWSEADSGRETDSWIPPNALSVAAVSPDGRVALLTESTSQPKAIRVWDLIARKELRAFDVPDQGRLVPYFAPDSWHVAVADRGRLRLWDVVAGKELWQREGVVHPDRPEGFIGFNPDGRTLVTQKTSSAPNQRVSEIFVLDRLTGQVVRSFLIPNSSGQVLTPDGKGLVVHTMRPPVSIDIWDLEAGQMRFRLGGDLGVNRSGPSAFSLDGTRLVTLGPGTTGNASVLVWEWPSGKQLRRIDLHVNQLNSLRFTPDGKRLEVSAAGETMTRLWDVETGQPQTPPEGHTSTVVAARLTTDGKAVTIAQDKTARFWDPATGRPLQEVSVPESFNQQVKSVSADGRVMVIAQSRTPTQFPVQILELVTGQVLHTVVPQGISVGQAALTRDCRLLATSPPASPSGLPNVPGGLNGGKGTRLWEVASGRELRQFDHPNSRLLALSPDGGFLATGGRDGVRVWSATTGRLVRSHPGDVFGLAFTPDGRTLACVTSREILGLESASGGIRWRVAIPENQLTGMVGVPLPVTFAPDGRRLALRDGIHGDGVRVWDVESGQALQSLTGHRGSITSAAFADDGRTLVTASTDNTALLWATPDRPRPPTELSAADATGAWAELVNADGAVAFRVITRLGADPARAVPLLRERLVRERPRTPAVDAGRVAQLVAQLDDGRFEVRERATRELAALGVGAAPALRQLLAGQPSPEGRRRAEEVLAKLDDPAPDAEALRDLRAVEVLEAVATPAARALLEELAKGDADARLTREAKASLDHLRRR